MKRKKIDWLVWPDMRPPHDRHEVMRVEGAATPEAAARKYLEIFPTTRDLHVYELGERTVLKVSYLLERS